MTEFTAVSPFFRYVILGLMFLVAIPAFALCVYKIVRKEKCVKEVIFFAIFLTLLAFFAGSSNNNKVIY
ncbi:MAG: hypothetical protein IJO19_00105, partial [Clostridia bacterium]|nr:hypothetical protein [Clostridia bacterium]